MLYEKEEKSDKFECENCICELLSNILKQQNEIKRWDYSCSFQNIDKSGYIDTIPFILQTPYGHPYFTWGEIGTKDCFVTVFFKVKKVDCKKRCAVLQLLRPDKSIIDPETECVETSSICGVDYVTVTKECILVDLSSYSAIKLISPKFVKESKQD